MRVARRPVCAVLCAALWAATLAAAVSAQPWRPVRGEIRGIVRTLEGEPLAGAKVSLSGPQSAELATTQSGSFSFPGLAPGRYTVEVGAEGRVSSWAEEIDVASATAPYLVFELAEGKSTSVTVTFAPVLDGAPTGPVWRLSERASWTLPSAGSAPRLSGLLSLGPEPGEALLEGNAPRLGGLLFETLPAEWLAGVSSPVGASSAAVAGRSIGEELVLEVQTPTGVWTGGAWLSHRTRSLEGRDRRRLEVSDGGAAGVAHDRDRSAERLALSGGGRLGGGWSLGLGQLFGQQSIAEQLATCASCPANPRVGAESETDVSTAALRHDGRFGLTARWMEADESLSAVAAFGRGDREEEQRGARLTVPLGSRSLLGLTAGDRRTRNATEGYFPGSSALTVLAGEGGDPRRGPGSEAPQSPGESFVLSRGEAFTGRWQQQLGAQELRLGVGRSRFDFAEAVDLQRTGLLWKVPAAGGTSPGGHALVVSERRSAELRAEDDSAWAEWRLRSPRAALLGGLRWQGGELRSARGVSVSARDSWLPRLAVALDPRGMGQERFLFSVARVAEETDGLVPWLFDAATELSLLGESLNDSVPLFAGASPEVLLPARLAPERSTLWTGSAEHLLLPGLVVGATARYRVVDRGLRARELAPGQWQLEESDVGVRGEGACARSLTSGRLWATWKGARSELFLAADSTSRHGLRSADCLSARPAALRSRAPLGRAAGSGRSEEQRLELLGFRRFGERWAVGTALFWKNGEIAPLGTIDVLERGQWLTVPELVDVSSRSAWRADVALHYRLPMSEEGGLILTAEVLNLFDGRGALGEQQSLSLSPDVEGAAGARDPRAGQAVLLQPPRAVRLRLGWRW